MINHRIVETETGQLALYIAGELIAQPVNPVLSFPFSSPDEGISIVDEYSKEIVWLEDLDLLEETSRVVVKKHLQQREFRPRVVRIVSVNTYSTPSTWGLETDVGLCKFELPSEESIRRLAGNRLVLTHTNGMQFIIDNMMNLDTKSKQILARFMA
jgi:hypothetical protein